MPAVTSTTSEAAVARSHSILTGDASVADRLDQALEADQQQRRAREAVLRRWLGYTHNLRTAALQMSMFWIPTTLILIGLPKNVWESEALFALLSLVLVSALATPLLSPLLILAAWLAARQLLKRAKVESIEINRVVWQDPLVSASEEARVNAAVQRKVNQVFSDECTCAWSCVWLTSPIPVVFGASQSTLLRSGWEGSMVSLLVLMFVLWGLAAIIASCWGLISFFHRRAILKDARRNGFSVRDPASSPWS